MAEETSFEHLECRWMITRTERKSSVSSISRITTGQISSQNIARSAILKFNTRKVRWWGLGEKGDGIKQRNKKTHRQQYVIPRGKAGGGGRRG